MPKLMRYGFKMKLFTVFVVNSARFPALNNDRAFFVIFPLRRMLIYNHLYLPPPSLSWQAGMATANFPIFELEEGGNKRLSVERIYQRKTQLEHILLRPDTYIGSVEESSEQMYVFDEEKGAIVKRQITFVPGLYKIFDEILGTLVFLVYMCI